MNPEQKERISDELLEIAKDLAFRHLTEKKNVDKLVRLSDEIHSTMKKAVEDNPHESERVTIED